MNVITVTKGSLHVIFHDSEYRATPYIQLHGFERSHFGKFGQRARRP